MSAHDLTEDERCPICGADSPTCTGGNDTDTDDRGRDVLVCSWVCHECGERFTGYVINENGGGE